MITDIKKEGVRPLAPTEQEMATLTPIDKCYRNLACAIITQGVKDWKKGSERKKLEKWFLSDEPETLCGIEGKEILKILKDKDRYKSLYNALVGKETV